MVVESYQHWREYTEAHAQMIRAPDSAHEPWLKSGLIKRKKLGSTAFPTF